MYCFMKDGVFLYDKNTNKRIELNTKIDVAKFMKANSLPCEFLQYLVEEVKL